MEEQTSGPSGTERVSELRFLVVEDHGFQRWILSNILETMGAKFLYSAADGLEALAILEDREPPVDIIITDLDMPGMDGLEFIRHLGRLRYPASLIVASGMDASLITTVETMAKEYGVTLLGSIQKPVTAKKVHAAIDAWKGHPTLDSVPMAQFSIKEVELGLRRGEFVAYFQPQVDLKSEELKGAEALVRWRHPQFRIVRPAVFMDAFESGPLIGDLTWMMLRQAARACADWRAAGLKTAVSVNVSLRSLADVGFAERLLSEVRDMGLDPHDLIVEVTESAAAASLGPMLENFGRLRMRGFGLSIDDFGTGYSSMERLARVPFTELKIDRTFVTNAGSQAPSRAMLESSLEAAQKLGIHSVAEGVEKRAEWDLVRALKCDLAQGYFMARPMEAGEIPGWAQSRWRASA